MPDPNDPLEPIQIQLPCGGLRLRGSELPYERSNWLERFVAPNEILLLDGKVASLITRFNQTFMFQVLSVLRCVVYNSYRVVSPEKCAVIKNQSKVDVDQNDRGYFQNVVIVYSALKSAAVAIIYAS